MKLLAANEYVQQAGDMLINACWKIAGIVLIMAIVAFAFMYIKYRIKKKITDKKNEQKQKK